MERHPSQWRDPELAWSATRGMLLPAARQFDVEESVSRVPELPKTTVVVMKTVLVSEVVISVGALWTWLCLGTRGRGRNARRGRTWNRRQGERAWSQGWRVKKMIHQLVVVEQARKDRCQAMMSKKSKRGALRRCPWRNRWWTKWSMLLSVR